MISKIKQFFQKLPEHFYPHYSCFCCGKELFDNDGSNLCSKCKEQIFPLENTFSTYGNLPTYSYCHYDELARSIVLDAKDNDKPYFAHLMAHFMAKVIVDNNLEFDFITYVPTGKKNYRKRGYDYIKILAKTLSKLVNSTVVTTLTKGIDVVDQTLVPRQDRYKNVNNSFVINQKVNVKDKKILILDDIVTSGATLNTCAQELIKYGAYSVTALTFSRAVARKESQLNKG